MIEDEEKPIRYHLTENFVLEQNERVFLERCETETINCVRQGDVPEHAKTPELLLPYLREIALTQGGEAWRAVTERGELLRLFTVSELAEELSGRTIITMHPKDQFWLAVARLRLNLPLRAA
jgi:hypothetical protein